MKTIIKRHWPLIAAIGILFVTVLIFLILSIKQNQGHLVYALDDPYIHMAIAKNFAQYGVWGVTKYNFSSSSSSLLWTLLLSCIYFLFGVNEVTPFLLNIIFGSLLVFWVYFILRKYVSNLFFIFIVLSSIIFFTPLPALIFTGQEHTLHILLTVAFVYLSAGIVSSGRINSLRAILLLILAPLVIMTRYEGLFLVFVVGCLFVVKRNPLYALFLGGFGILPIVVCGLFSVSKGWYFLPNPVLLKGNMLDSFALESIINFFRSGYQQMIQRPHISMLIFGTLVVSHFRISKEMHIWKDSIIMIPIFIGTACLHMQFARTGWFYRYEAYLVALGILILGISLHEYLPKKSNITINKKLIPRYIPLIFFVLFTLTPFFVRGTFSLINVPQATKNIYEQHYQIGMFLKKFYQKGNIAANDIGAINYFADIECLDLAGLGNVEVARAKMGGNYNSQEIYELANGKGIRVAIVYEELFDKHGGIPSQWIKIGKWKILHNVICAFDEVSFYAVDPTEKNILMANLREFSHLLPKDIIQTGLYAEGKTSAYL